MNLFEFNLALPITDPTWVFFLVLIIILFAPMILGRLHIPHIIGMILAGVLIGEHGFHVLDRDSSFELFGKVGLYYIMFLAGLEMDMEDFKKNRTKSVVFGWLTQQFHTASDCIQRLHNLTIEKGQINEDEKYQPLPYVEKDCIQLNE